MADSAPKTAADYETQMRANAASQRHMDRARKLEERGMYDSAGRAMERADKAAEAVRERARVRDLIKKEYGATNTGEAYQEYRRRTDMKDRMTQEEFEKDLRNKARTDQERKDRDQKNRSTDEPSGAGRSGTGTSDKGLATEGTLKQILNKIKERPILVA